MFTSVLKKAEKGLPLTLEGVTQQGLSLGRGRGSKFQETRENYKHALCFCREKIDVSKALITNRLQSSVITGLLKVPSPMHEALHQD